MTAGTVNLVWFRQDLRLDDNPALYRAALHQGAVLPVYILDENNPGRDKPGAASRFWLYHALLSLQESLEGHLCFYRGDPLTILRQLVGRHAVRNVFYNRCYEPWAIKRDKVIAAALNEQSVAVHSFNASLLWEPWTVKKSDQTPYRVFTPFYRKGCPAAPEPRLPLPAPEKLCLFRDRAINGQALPKPRCQEDHLLDHWQINEEGGRERLRAFLRHGLQNYKYGRNLPALDHVSRLSPYLRSGQLSPHQIRDAVPAIDADSDHFCSELGWREFSYHLLYFNPELPIRNMRTKFDLFPWEHCPEKLELWQCGMTGIPIVDAGMRQLRQMGYIHNRVRMIVGSFLVKNLLIHWHEGARWFWDNLVDADLANNSAGWQWIAGCGADAAPYFRIFNPVSQGQKFDPDGTYTKRYVPELSGLPPGWLFNPWEAPEGVLRKAGIVLGVHYPEPVVDLKLSRQRALEAFASINQPE